MCTSGKLEEKNDKGNNWSFGKLLTDLNGPVKVIVFLDKSKRDEGLGSLQTGHFKITRHFVHMGQ